MHMFFALMYTMHSRFFFFVHDSISQGDYGSNRGHERRTSYSRLLQAGRERTAGDFTFPQALCDSSGLSGGNRGRERNAGDSRLLQAISDYSRLLRRQPRPRAQNLLLRGPEKNVTGEGVDPPSGYILKSFFCALEREPMDSSSIMRHSYYEYHACV